MKEKKFDKKPLPSILPFLLLGMGIAILVSLIVMFFYLFIWGVIIGFILWAIMALKEKFFPTVKAKNHKVLHVEEDGSVIVEKESSSFAHKPHTHKHSHKE